MKTEVKNMEVIRQWFFDEHIVAFVLQSNERFNIDLYADWLIETLQAWPAEKPLLIAYDLKSVVFTPHARKRAIDVYDAVPTCLRGRTAIIFPPGPVGNFLKIFANKAMRVQNPRMKRQFFVNLDEALLWLQEMPEAIPT
ncbi:MAG: hypothetical protein K8I82_19625 [Anaerolineae bacterium]|nr:hypothetical protein [Anaerolineae bacterium]